MRCKQSVDQLIEAEISHEWRGNMSPWRLNPQWTVSAARGQSAILYVQYIQKELQESTVKHNTNLCELLSS